MNDNNYRLKVATHKGERTILKNNIVSCKQFSFGSAIYLDDGTHFLMKERIGELISILNSERFFIIDEDTMINIKYVDAILPNYLLMSNGERFLLSGSRRKAFFDRINQFFELDYNVQT
jgi:hypothetical protein